jgi:hypothetical protein
VENDDDRPGLADEIYINHHHDLSAVARIPTLAVRYGLLRVQGAAGVSLFSRTRCSEFPALGARFAARRIATKRNPFHILSHLFSVPHRHQNFQQGRNQYRPFQKICVYFASVRILFGNFGS